MAIWPTGSASWAAAWRCWPTTLGPAWNDTMVIVVSEFGRTFRENGDHGTDHGHGSVYWVLGGGVRGGQIAGRQVAVNAGEPVPGSRLAGAERLSRLDRRRAAARAYGLSQTQIGGRFSPSASPQDLSLV